MDDGDGNKYMQAITSIEDSKYSHCHLVDDVSLKQPPHSTQYASSAGSISLNGGNGGGVGCHSGGDEVAGDSMTTVIKSEEGVSHSYVLPPFMH